MPTEIKDYKNVRYEENEPHISVKILSLIGIALFFIALLFSHTFTWN